MSTSSLSYLTPLQSSFLIYFTFLVALIVILFKVKSPLQFYVRLGVYLFIMVFSTVIYIPVAALRPKDTLNFIWLGKLFKAICCICYGFQLEVENVEHIGKDEPFIIVCNHQSALDLVPMVVAWPQRRTTVLGKKELFYTGPVGLIFWLCGMTFIDRANANKAKNDVNSLADRLVRDNLRVWIYPEGTRNTKTELLPFKKGAFHLAIQAQIPIVCVCVSSYSNFYNKKEKKFLSNGIMKVRILEPVPTKGLSTNDVNSLANELRDRMQIEIDKLNEEIGLDKKYYTKHASLDMNNNETKLKAN